MRKATPVHVRTRARLVRRFRLATARFRVFPSFLIIGAQRAGTTSLFEYLRRHPDVVGPLRGAQDVYLGKEVHFFDTNFHLGVDWYRSFFPTTLRRRVARRLGGDLVAGESTPYYLFHPAVPTRVATVLPDVRLIVLLRDPVERAYSHYHLMRRKRLEKFSFEDAVAAEEERLVGKKERILADPAFRSYQHRHHAYLARGFYAEQLQRWFSCLPRQQFLVLRTEDFAMRPADIYAQALDFLGLRPMPLPAIRHRNQRPYPPLDQTLRAHLQEQFAEPNAKLSRLLGQEFDWRSSIQQERAVTGADPKP